MHCWSPRLPKGPLIAAGEKDQRNVSFWQVSSNRPCRARLGGPSGVNLPGLWLCFSCSSPPSQTQIKATPKALQIQSAWWNVSFVGLDISFAQSRSSFRVGRLKKCFHNLWTWCSLSNSFKTFCFWKNPNLEARWKPNMKATWGSLVHIPQLSTFVIWSLCVLAGGLSIFHREFQPSWVMFYSWTLEHHHRRIRMSSSITSTMLYSKAELKTSERGLRLEWFNAVIELGKWEEEV